MRRSDNEVMRCDHCGEALESHPVLFHTWICRQCEIEYDDNNRRIDWDKIDYQIKREKGLD